MGIDSKPFHDCHIFCRLVSGDYRGFVMIWEVEDIEEELVLLERRMKNLQKDRCVTFLHQHLLL